MNEQKKIIRKKYSELEIADDLEKFIVDNNLRANTPLASARQLAERYNVSQMTVNRAISRLVEKKIVYRQRGSGTFVDEVVPGFGTHVCTVGLGLYQPPLDNKQGFDEAFGSRSDQLLDQLKAKGCRISLLTRAERKNPDALKHFLHEIDVLAINKDLLTPDNMPVLLNWGRPVVLLNLPQIRNLPFNQVAPDHYMGFCKVLERFETSGCTEVLIAATNTEAHECRRDLFRKIVKNHAHKLKIIGDLTYPFIPGDMGQRLGNLLGRKYLDRQDRPAIFCVSDFLAIGITEVLLDAGLRPKKDFKLISFDNLEGLGVTPFAQPMITSLTHNRSELVNEEVNMILSAVTNPSRNNRIVTVPCGELIIRKTC
jgi:DNA-binding LacI/PurR family transcriptional regulator